MLTGTLVCLALLAPAQAVAQADRAAKPQRQSTHKSIVPLTADLKIVNTTAGADGQRHTTQMTQHMYRDSRGRTRVEAGSAVTISDPVSRSTVMLDTGHRTYHRTYQQSTAEPQQKTGPARQLKSKPQLSSPARDLGTRTMQGLRVEGRTQTVTMPAKAGASAKTWQVTSWSAPHIKLPVQTRVVDSSGTESIQTYTNIRTGTEPGAALFAIPAGYRSARSQASAIAPAVDPTPPPDTTPCPINAPGSVPVISFDIFLGAAVVEATTDGGAGCRFIDSYGYAEAPLRGSALTGLGMNYFQWLVYDDGGPVPAVPWFAYGVIEFVAQRDGVQASYFDTLIVLYIDS